jgi:monofunctional glycosyltransferase
MALNTYKRWILKLSILGTLMILLIIPIFMYFSHDVTELNTLYPEFHELKKERPKNWVNLKQISKYGIWAIVLSEDWGFYQHQGFDLNQIQIALEEMMDGSRFRGASTITQQMIKNVYLTEERSIWRKVYEIILAYKVEKVLSKNRILEIYLNVIEFGPNIYGIKNASFHYFNKHPSLLGPREGAFLAMLLPGPKRYYVSFKHRKLTNFAQKRIDAILGKMRMGKVITPDQYQQLRAVKFSWEK